MQIDISNAIAGLKRLQREVRRGVADGLGEAADSYVDELRHTTDYPFQTVPSYILEHYFKPGSGAKVYTEGTRATFAHNAPSAGAGRALFGTLGATSAEGGMNLGGTEPIVQHYFSISGPIYTKLQSSDVRKSRDELGVDVGYPEDVTPDNPSYRHIFWVYFGTVKMIARPFIEEIVYGQSGTLRSKLVKHVEAAINRATT